MNKKLLVLEGPTASGKSALGIALAKRFNTLILSSDSRQFYKEMTIGTAKTTLEEQAGIKHYFTDSHSIQNPLSAADFEREAMEVLENEFEKHDVILVVGGSGLYTDALCKGLDDLPHDPATREALNVYFHENGLDDLLAELSEKDPAYFKEVDQANPMRVIRALEVIRISNKPFSSFLNQKVKKRPFEIHRYVLDIPRPRLYERINQRVLQMIEKGLVEEVKSLVKYRHLNPLNTVGYAEIFDYLDGTISLERSIELIQQNSRRYAKRQLTWFRRNENAIWISELDTEKQADAILERFLNSVN